MDYSKFYTPPHIASLLIEQIKINAPEKIIDICCGSGNLLHEANKKWKKARLIGIDIKEHHLTNIDCIKMDGRKYAIEHNNEYSLVVANPPFDHLEKRCEYPELYKLLPSKYTTSRLEIEMLAANLSLLNDDGTLLIIMPSTFVNAVTHRKIRKYLGNNYYIQKIIKLPLSTFGTSNINSYALIIKKGFQKKRYTQYYTVTSYGNISKLYNISPSRIKAGCWEKDDFDTNEYENIQLDIKRGNLSSSSFNSSGTPILHTAKNDLHWQPSTRYTLIENSKGVYAEKGDIIVSRVGKSAGKWFLYAGHRIQISDCLFCIKDPSRNIYKTIQGKNYSLPLKGVATRYITIADFKRWYLSLLK